MTGAIEMRDGRPTLAATRLGAVECARYGAGPAVLLLHGAMGGWDQGLLLGRATLGAAGHELIAVSRPGYLGTPLDRGREPERQADLCAAVLDSLGIREAAAVAISGGGQCALQFALRHPERCAALILISACSAPLMVKAPFRFQMMCLMARVPGMLERMRRRVETDPEAAAARSIPDPDLRARTLSDSEAGPLFRRHLSMTMERMRDRLAGTRNDIEQSRMPFAYPLREIRTPALIVHGTADQAVPFAQAEATAAALPCAELLAIPDGQHVSLFTHLDVIRARVRQFLEIHWKEPRPASGLKS